MMNRKKGAELRAIYREKGLRGPLLDRVVGQLTADEERWLRVMVRDELGVIDEGKERPWVQGLLVGVAFMLGALVPILPFLTDSPEQLRQTVAAIADAGARSVTPIVLHLRSGAREWYYEWLQATYPSLVPRYRALYRNGSYAPSWYQDRITSTVREFATAYGLVRPKAVDPDPDQQTGSFRNARKTTARAAEPAETQPALWDDEDLNPS